MHTPKQVIRMALAIGAVAAAGVFSWLAAPELFSAVPVVLSDIMLPFALAIVLVTWPALVGVAALVVAAASLQHVRHVRHTAVGHTIGRPAIGHRAIGHPTIGHRARPV